MATIKTRWLLSIMLVNLPNCSLIGGKLMKAFVQHCQSEIRLSLHDFLCFTCACVFYYIMQLHVLLALLGKNIVIVLIC